ncbi:hypothetical protein C9374_012612 [Naegleria lovaniensis]|uniref:EGF-like domain-containing protein n=1 Tax=Naegleria lovaniensis TaxID=51637 RepID=A0AA88GWR3_NAELO|nr:uncharacterized protein C9374_012612 [Naegleria lovaniensis]KAG2392360.1 hypothetical protein C9374_012612 [Naegleria lovaniensis]
MNPTRAVSTILISLLITLVLATHFVSSLTVPCSDMTFIHGACTSQSSLQVNSKFVVSSSNQSQIVSATTDYQSMTYVVANAFDQYGSFSFNGLKKGVLSKVNSAGNVVWSKNLNDCGHRGSVYSIGLLSSNAAPVIGGSVEYINEDAQLRCVLGGALVELWNDTTTPREVSYIATLDKDGNLKRLYSLDQFKGSKLAQNALVIDDQDHITVGHSLVLDGALSEENPTTLTVDGKNILLTHNFNALVSKISNDTNPPKLLWSTKVCEHSEGSSCTIVSMHSSSSIDHMIVVILSVSGTVTIGGNTQVTSEGSRPNLFIVVLSKYGVVRYVRNMLKSTSYVSTEPLRMEVSSGHAAGQVVLATTCDTDCYLNGQRIANGISMSYLDVFAINVKWTKTLITFEYGSIGRASSLSMDVSRNIYLTIEMKGSFKIVDSASRTKTFHGAANTILLCKISSTDGTIYWVQDVSLGPSAWNVLVRPTTFNIQDSSQIAPSNVPIVFNEIVNSNQASFSFKSYASCSGLVREVSRLGPFGGSGGTTLTITNKVKYITFQGYGVDSVEFGFFDGSSSIRVGNSVSYPSQTITFDPDEIILQLVIETYNHGLFGELTTLGYMKIVTDKQTFEHGRSKDYKRMVTTNIPSSENVIGWIVRHGTYIDAIGYITGDVRDGLPRYCDCNSGFTGAICSVPTCYGRSKSDTNACNGIGQCVGPNQCSCPNYVSADFHNCQSYAFCNNHSSLNAANVCNGHGICRVVSPNSPDQCNCNIGYFGENCQYSFCFGIMSNDSTVCSGHGKCIGPDTCKCDDNTVYTGKQCSIPVCYGIDALKSAVCSSRGTCEKPNSCKCNDNYFGSRCENFNCFDVFKNDSTVCSGNGTCMSYNNCTCNKGYSGAMCDDWTCFGIPKNQSNLVCSGNGICSSYDQCTCKPKTTGKDCSNCTSFATGPYCDKCIDKHYGEDCSNTILGNLNMIQKGNTLQFKMSSQTMTPSKSGSIACDKVMSSNTLKFFDIVQCSFTRDSSYTYLEQFNSTVVNNTGYNYTITLSGDLNATFIPNTVMEINVLCLYDHVMMMNSIPIYISMPVSDKLLPYTEPTLSWKIPNGQGDLLNKCFESVLIVSPSQYEERPSFKSLVWQVITPGASSLVKTLFQNARDKTMVTIPYEMTVNRLLQLSVTLTTAFGKTKVFNISLNENPYETFESGATFQVTLEAVDKEYLYIPFSQFSKNPNCFQSQPPSGLRLSSSTEPSLLAFPFGTSLQVSASSYTRTLTGRTRLDYSSYSSSLYILIDLTLKIREPSIVLASNLVSSLTSSIQVTCLDYYNANPKHVVHVTCLDCSNKMRISQQLPKNSKTSSYGLISLSQLGTLVGSHLLSIKCSYSTFDESYFTGVVTPVVFVPSEGMISTNDNCQIISAGFKNQLSKIPYTEDELTYNLEVVMSSQNCKLSSLTVTKTQPSSDSILLAQDLILPYLFNYIPIRIKSNSIQLSNSRTGSFALGPENVFEIISSASGTTSSSKKVSLQTEPKPMDSASFSCKVSTYYPELGQSVTLSCSMASATLFTGSSFAVFIGSYQVTPSFNSFPISFTVLSAGNVYLQISSPHGSVNMHNLGSLFYVYYSMSFSRYQQQAVNTLSRYKNQISSPWAAKEFMRENSIVSAFVINLKYSSGSDLGPLVSTSLEIMSTALKLIFDEMFNQPGIISVQNFNYHLQQVYVLTQRREFMLPNGVIAVRDVLKSLFSFMQTSPKSCIHILTPKNIKMLGTIVKRFSNILEGTEESHSLTKSFLELVLSRSSMEVLTTSEMWDGNLSGVGQTPLAYGSVVRSDALDQFVLRSQRTNSELVRFSSENFKSLDLLLEKSMVLHYQVMNISNQVLPEEKEKNGFVAQVSLSDVTSTSSSAPMTSDGPVVFISIPITSTNYSTLRNEKVIECSVVFTNTMLEGKLSSSWGSGNSVCKFEGVSQVTLAEMGNVSMANCSCNLNKLNNAAATRSNSMTLIKDGLFSILSISQSTDSSNNVGVGVYIYDSNAVALALGLTFGLFLPLILCGIGIAAVVTVIFVLYKKRMFTFANIKKKEETSQKEQHVATAEVVLPQTELEEKNTNV